jgi:FKBP-type peptidyl-prolyl cis-trans isomerase
MLRKAPFILLVALSTALLAQPLLTQKKPAADKKPASPTKVSGKPVTTASGLQYWDIKKGTGAAALAGKEVSVHYTGWLLDGKEFDSSLDAGEPIQFTLGTGQVIKGWDEGIAGMKVGGKRQLRLLPVLGYGQRGFPPSIPPNATLVFDVELVAVK